MTSGSGFIRRIEIATGKFVNIGTQYTFSIISGIYINPQNILYVTSRHMISKLAYNSLSAQVVSGQLLVPGSQDGSLTTATWNFPNGIIGDKAGRYLYVTQINGNNVRRADISQGSSGLVTVVATFQSSVYGVAIDNAESNLYVTCSNVNSIYRINLITNNTITLFAGGGSVASK